MARPKGKVSGAVTSADEFHKKWGKVLIDPDEIVVANGFWSSGSPSVDALLGGGFPKGALSEIYGPEQAGKSTLALSTARQVIESGGRVLYIDLERGYDLRNARTREWLHKNGIDPLDPNFVVADPETGEDMYQMIIDAIQSGVFQLIVIDSMAAVTTKSELEGEIGDANVGAVSKLNSQALKILFRKFGKNRDTHLMILNQMRDKFGAMSFGPQTKSTGGRAVGHWVGMKIKLVKMGREAGVGDEVLTKVKVVVEKSRYGAARSVDIKISSERGVDTLQDVLEFAMDMGYIHRSGGWHYLYANAIDAKVWGKVDKKDRETLEGFIATQNGEDAMKLYLGASGWYETLYEVAVAAVSEGGIEVVDEG